MPCTEENDLVFPFLGYFTLKFFVWPLIEIYSTYTSSVTLIRWSFPLLCHLHFFLLPILHCALLFSGVFCLYKTNIAVFIIETWCFPTLSLPFDTLFSCTVFRLINKVDAEKKWRRKLPAEKNERRGKHIKPRENSILHQNWKVYSFSELKFKVMRQILIIEYYIEENVSYIVHSLVQEVRDVIRIWRSRLVKIKITIFSFIEALWRHTLLKWKQIMEI